MYADAFGVIILSQQLFFFEYKKWVVNKMKQNHPKRGKKRKLIF